MRLLLGLALRNLLAAPRRTGLLSLAIALVTMLFVVLLTVSQGIRDNLVGAATTMSAGHVNVSGFYKPTPNAAIPSRSRGSTAAQGISDPGGENGRASATASIPKIRKTIFHCTAW